MSQITSHILDTAKGKPAVGVAVILYSYQEHAWIQIAEGTTNNDGRVTDLLQKGHALPTGVYKIKFLTQAYFQRTATPSFYPYVEIVFVISSAEHYHIPLLLNPFGYTTYRGS